MRIMGIDLGIKKIAVSLWVDGHLESTEAFVSPANYRPQQLHDLAEEAWAQAAKLQPDFIFIEDTLIGNNRKYSIMLSQTMGAVQAALCDQSVQLVNVSTWKKTVIGDGRADKETVRNYILSSNSAYAELCEHDQDRFDAACIGYYGVLIAKRAGISLTG